MSNEKTQEEEKKYETDKDAFKEKLRYWRENGSPISIPDNFKAR